MTIRVMIPVMHLGDSDVCKRHGPLHRPTGRPVYYTADRPRAAGALRRARGPGRSGYPDGGLGVCQNPSQLASLALVVSMAHGVRTAVGHAQCAAQPQSVRRAPHTEVCAAHCYLPGGLTGPVVLPL
jgi:hypothetical protein